MTWYKNQSIDDIYWNNKNVEILDNERSKVENYTAGINKIWSIDHSLIWQFDQAMLKICHIHALFDNVPDRDFKPIDPVDITSDENDRDE